MPDYKFRFLSEKERFLGILNNRGREAEITDFARLLGGSVRLSGNRETGKWWLDNRNYVNSYGNLCKNDNDLDNWRKMKYPYYFVDEETVGARPVISYSQIKDIVEKETTVLGILEIECFSYPKNAVDVYLNEKLENKFNSGELKETSKTYTINNTVRLKVLGNVLEFIEYEYQGSKYIRFDAKYNIGEYLSNGRKIEENKPYWIKVEPITFLVDKRKDIAVSKYIIFAGMWFHDSQTKGSECNYSFINKYLNEEFAKDVIPSKTDNEIEKEYETSVTKNEKISVRMELTGYKSEIIEVLKDIQNNDKIVKQLVELNLLEQEKELKLEINNNHYRVRK